MSTPSRVAMVFLVALVLPTLSPAAPIPTFWYTVQAGAVSSPIEGVPAIRLLRACPNNDGGASLPNNVRVKVSVQDDNGNPIANFPSENICILFNGGTAAQGFSGVGADSIIANSTYNQSPLCPDVRCIYADAPTDQFGIAYITLAGATPGSPGVATRDANRKWGHYDSLLRVYVNGFIAFGRLTSSSSNGTYVLRIKNFDFIDGLGTVMNAGERVTVNDYNSIANNIGTNDAISYWRDVDSDGSVTITDLNIVGLHLNHDCGNPEP